VSFDSPVYEPGELWLLYHTEDEFHIEGMREDLVSIVHVYIPAALALGHHLNQAWIVILNVPHPRTHCPAHHPLRRHRL
jgi:hypothetical protein